MTDPFEEAVRSAGRALAPSDPSPTYHGAWKRGRRRRIAKRSALAVAGALALVVAFGTDVGRFPGGGSTIEVDDVAVETEVAPAPEPVATTEPVITSGNPGADDDAGSAAATTAPDLDIERADDAAPPGDEDATGDAASAPVPTPVPTPTDATSTGPAATQSGGPTPTPQPESDATINASPLPNATDEVETFTDPNASGPTDDASTSDRPADTPGTGDPAATDDHNVQGDPNAQAETDDPGPALALDDGAGDGRTGDDGTDDGLSDSGVDEADGADGELPGPAQAVPPAAPEAATRLGLPADARVLPGAGPNEGERKCDVDGDGTAETLCELLPNYRCLSSAEARVDYAAFDVDGDGAIDTCAATVATTCDTTGDGIGDAVCRIRFETFEENPDDEGP